MHGYSTDSSERRIVPLSLALLAIALAWVTSKSLATAHLSLPWWADAPSIIAFYGVLYAAVDRHLRPDLLQEGKHPGLAHLTATSKETPTPGDGAEGKAGAATSFPLASDFSPTCPIGQDTSTRHVCAETLRAKGLRVSMELL